MSLTILHEHVVITDYIFVFHFFHFFKWFDCFTAFIFQVDIWRNIADKFFGTLFFMNIVKYPIDLPSISLS